MDKYIKFIVVGTIILMAIDTCKADENLTFEIAKPKRYAPGNCSSRPSTCPNPQSRYERIWSHCFQCSNGTQPHCVPIGNEPFYICSSLEDLYLDPGYFARFHVEQDRVLMRAYRCPLHKYIMGHHDSRLSCKKHLEIHGNELVEVHPGTETGEPALVKCKDTLCPSKPEYSSTFPYTNKIQRSLGICIECGNSSVSKERTAINSTEQNPEDRDTSNNATPSSLQIKTSTTSKETHQLDLGHVQNKENKISNNNSLREQPTIDAAIEPDQRVDTESDNGIVAIVIIVSGCVAIVAIVAIAYLSYKACKQNKACEQNKDSIEDPSPEKAATGSTTETTINVDGDLYMFDKNDIRVKNNYAGAPGLPMENTQSEEETLDTDTRSTSLPSDTEEVDGDGLDINEPLLDGLKSFGDTKPGVQETGGRRSSETDLKQRI